MVAAAGHPFRPRPPPAHRGRRGPGPRLRVPPPPHERGRWSPARGIPSALVPPEPTGTGVDQAPDLKPPLPVRSDPNERAVVGGARREPTKLLNVERPRLGEL